MNTRKFLIFMLLVAMASLSWGIDLGLCADYTGWQNHGPQETGAIEEKDDLSEQHSDAASIGRSDSPSRGQIVRPQSAHA